MPATPAPVSTVTVDATPGDRTVMPHPGRLIALDVLRGIAILGTFLTNIWIFSSAAAGRSLNPLERTDAEPEISGSLISQISSVFDTGINLVTDGKFIGLLTIMFGIGLEIQRQSALRRGERWPGRYPWRAGLLILDGLLNYIFIFEFDVLMGYGLTGLVVAAILATSPRVQKVWMGIGITAHLALMALTTPFILERLVPVDRGGDATTSLSDQIAEADQATGGLTITDGTYWGGVVDRLTNFVGGRAEIPIMFLMGLGLFLVGAHLYRAGLFEERGRRRRIRVMALSFGIGLPIDWTLRLFFVDEAGAIPRYVTSSLVSFGVLALVAHFYVGRKRSGAVGTALSYVGRMALTCYILQNLLASIVFLPWGLNVAAHIEGEWSTLWTLLIYVVLSGVLIGLSMLWLRRFPRGPIELVWHRSYTWICDRLDARAERRRSRRLA